jgi:hypothetical protein
MVVGEEEINQLVCLYVCPCATNINKQVMGTSTLLTKSQRLALQRNVDVDRLLKNDCSISPTLRTTVFEPIFSNIAQSTSSRCE